MKFLIKLFLKLFILLLFVLMVFYFLIKRDIISASQMESWAVNLILDKSAEKQYQEEISNDQNNKNLASSKENKGEDESQKEQKNVSEKFEKIVENIKKIDLKEGYNSAVEWWYWVQEVKEKSEELKNILDKNDESENPKS